MDKLPGKNQSPNPTKIPFFCYLLPVTCYLLLGCSFDYGSANSGEKGLPDIVMDNVEYVRVRSMDPQARLQAERVERYEERRIMELRNFSFEQFGNHGEEINAHGRAGSALFEIDSGDIRMDDGVRLDVDSEDIAMETKQLEWKDKERTLTGGADEEVHVYQENGTSFTGIGFQADARTRSWSFTDTVNGTYIYDGDEEDDDVDKDDGDSKEAVSVEISPNPESDGEKDDEGI
jgi:LPS export ABC transporter protein LptC